MSLSKDLPVEFTLVLKDLLPWLEATQTPYVTIGGIGVSLLAGARATKDIDALLWLDTGDVESFLESGVAYGFAPRISDAADFARSRRVLLLQHQPTGVPVDLSCGALPFENEMIARARTLDIGSLKLKVATPEDLVIMKAVAHRPKDITDIEAILSIEQNLDLERIRFWVHQFAEVLEMPGLIEGLEKILRR
ncbi:MAG: nucleotidyl transferase AbiEii/AbiGii toxin family protein [Blastocatellales bacterium]